MKMDSKLIAVFQAIICYYSQKLGGTWVNCGRLAFFSYLWAYDLKNPANQLFIKVQCSFRNNSPIPHTGPGIIAVNVQELVPQISAGVLLQSIIPYYDVYIYAGSRSTDVYYICSQLSMLWIDDNYIQPFLDTDIVYFKPRLSCLLTPSTPVKFAP